MENYVLYDEIGNGDERIVYKGRRKETTQFVSVHCIEKSKRSATQNDVKVNYELKHENIVQFYDWYETNNHLWLIKELCTGDSIQNILKQDKYLPEETVFSFGKDLVAGLLYLHANNIIYSDLCPAKVLLDSSGILKFSNFTKSILVTDLTTSDNMTCSFDSLPYYISPEILSGGSITIYHDLWGLGCILYEMFTGVHPFKTMGTEQDLNGVILENEPMYPIQGKNDNQASESLYMLIQGLLQKDISQRIDWLELCLHPFWKGDLNHLADVVDSMADSSSLLTCIETASVDDTLSVRIETKQELEQDVNQVLDQSVVSKSNNREPNDMHAYSLQLPPSRGGLVSLSVQSEYGHLKGSKLAWPDQISHGKPIENLTEIKSPTFPQTPHKEEKDGAEDEERESVSDIDENSDTSLLDRTGYSLKPSVMVGLNVNIVDILFHESDLIVMPLAENSKFVKVPSLVYEPNELGFTSFSFNQVSSMSLTDVNVHLDSISIMYSSMKGNLEKKHTRQKLSILAYLITICKCSEVANSMLQNNHTKVLLNEVKTSGCNLDVKMRTGRVLSVIASRATYVSSNFKMNEVFTTVTDQMKQNFLNSQFQRAFLPVLGEFLFYAATQEENENKEISSWEPAGATFTIINKCLSQSNDNVTQHFAAKIVDNVTTTTGRYCKKFLSNETGMGLWSLYNHASNDFEKITAASALSHISIHSSTSIQHVCSRVGLSNFKEALFSGTQKTQQSFYTVFVMLMSSSVHSKVMLQDKSFINKICHNLDGTSYVLRGKMYLLIADICTRSNQALLWVCQDRLLLVIEKDAKRLWNGDKQKIKEDAKYCRKCLQLLIHSIVGVVPSILTDCIAVLDDISHRHHPSSNQIKSLKTRLPLLSVCLYMTTSLFIRKRLVDKTFISYIGNLFEKVMKVKSGEINLSCSNTLQLGVSTATTVFSIVEAITQQTSLLLEYLSDIVECILPVLYSFSKSEDDSMKVLAMKLYSDICLKYLDNGIKDEKSKGAANIFTSEFVNVIKIFCADISYFLQQADPVASYCLKLLHSCSKHEQLVKMFDDGIISSIFLKFRSLEQAQVSDGPLHSIVGILSNVLKTSESVPFQTLVEGGLVSCLRSAFINISIGDNTITSSPVFLALLTLLYHTLRYIEVTVKKILTAGNNSSKQHNPTKESVEGLLRTTKVLSDLQGFLFNLLNADEEEVINLACRCLYMAVELYGAGDCDTDEETFGSITNVLLNSAGERKIMLLRIVKRIILADASAREIFLHVTALRELLQSFANLPGDDYINKKVKNISKDLLSI